jgi:4-aminobutyrate aminotransferase-like enzyme
MDDERIIDNARAVGEYLASRLREAAADHPAVAEIRAVGLAIGAEIAHPGTTDPDPATTRAIVNGMRGAGVLIGTTGRHGNVLKIRPPLIFGRDHADQLVQSFREVVAGPAVRRRPAPERVEPRVSRGR